MSESEEGDGGGFVGFLFGNVNEKGELDDDDLLDAESRRQLGGLNRILGSFVDDLKDGADRADGDACEDGEPSSSAAPSIDFRQKAASAVDYADIDEVIAEQRERYVHTALKLAGVGPSKQTAGGDDDYDEEDEETPSVPSQSTATEASASGPTASVIQPPPVQPVATSASGESTQTDKTGVPPSSKEVANETATSSAGGDASASMPATTFGLALAGRTAEEISELAMKYFPEFHPNKVLRFSRLFGPNKPSSRPQLWKNVKNARKRGQPLSSEDELRPMKLEYGQRHAEEVDAGDEEHFLASQVRGMGKASSANRQASNLTAASSKTASKHGEAAAWRHGPARLLYDLAQVPEDAVTLDYGFRLQTKNEVAPDHYVDETPSAPSADLPEDVFYMVSQSSWEDDVIIGPETLMQRGSLKVSTLNFQLLQRRGSHSAPTTPASAWRPRTPVGSRPPGAAGAAANMPGAHPPASNPSENEPHQSIFQVENQALIDGSWLQDTIWDAKNMDRLPSPIVMKLDANDENLLFGFPDDVPSGEDLIVPATTKKEAKKSKTYPSKQGRNQDEAKPEAAIPLVKDPFNLSNDHFYTALQSGVPELHSSSVTTRTVNLQHSKQTMELHPSCFPTHLSVYELRHHHRIPWKWPERGGFGGVHHVASLTKHIRRKAKEREKERAASGGGEMFFMRTLEDLSGTDGDLVLAEYCEEHPPLVMQRGMAARITNYYRRKSGHDVGPPKLSFGETAYVQQSPFLGNFVPGECVQALECGLFRSPIYEHSVPRTDFVLIRTADGFKLRDANAMFCVGQECPKIEVPGPNSKRASEHIREFLKLFIYRLFEASSENPRRIKMEVIRKAFPSHSESSVRKRLKICADFKRTGAGNDCGWWVLKEEHQLPTEEKLRAMVTPEQCCAFYSMLAAEQRLKDAGFAGKSLFAEEEDEDSQKIDDEVLTAPWHTTRNFLSALKGKCQLQVVGNADPTGCGEGFSYVRVPNKPTVVKEEASTGSPLPPKKQRAVTGTDADLRRLSLKNARSVLLNDFNFREEEIAKLGRWEVIDAVRTMSTEAAKTGDGGTSSTNKFARGSRFSVAEHQERFREDCQRIFDIQNRVLGSSEPLSTDEDSSDEDGENLDEIVQHLDSFLKSEKSASQLTHEQEEVEREKLREMLDREKSKTSKNLDRSAAPSPAPNTPQDGGKRDKDEDDISLASVDSSGMASRKNRRLIIHRTLRDSETGRLFIRREIVKRPAVIDAYLKMKCEKDGEWAGYVNQNEQHREDMRREKRRIQEQLRRIKRNEEKERIRQERKRKKEMEKELNPNLAKMKCGACGRLGHMKTNKTCPMYQGGYRPVLPAPVVDEQEPVEEEEIEDRQLVKVEDTKISFHRSLIEVSDKLRRDALRISIPRDLIRKRRRTASDLHCDYLQARYNKTSHRRRTNPTVELGNVFEKAIEKMKGVPDSYPFHVAVSVKHAPDYYEIVKEPIHLQLMRDNIRQGVYTSREQFSAHVDRMVNNCILYNGQQHQLTKVAEEMRRVCQEELEKSSSQLVELERQINPLLDNDPWISYGYLLETIVKSMRMVPESWPFHQPVPARDVPDYYTIIKDPMDLSTIQKKCNEQQYQTREEFRHDVALMESNSLLYNGANSNFTKTAQKMVVICDEALESMSEQLGVLEQEIIAQQYGTPFSSMANSPMLKPPGLGSSQPQSWQGNDDSIDSADLQELLQRNAHNSDEDIDIEMPSSVGAGLNYESLRADLEASSGEDDEAESDDDVI